MTVFLNDLKRARISLIIWTGAIGFMLAVTVFVFPLIATMMNGIDFSSLGAFGSALGAAGAVFTSITDYFCVEATSVLGLGGAMFAAIAGASALSKEIREHTAEFLFTHPVRRSYVAGEKLAAAVAQAVVLDVFTAGVSALAMLIIREKPDVKVLLLFYAAMLIMHLEITLISFALSVFLPRGSVGIGVGLVFGFYFLNILSSITEKLEFFRYATPFSYIDSFYIRQNGALDYKYIAAGAGLAAVCLVLAFLKFRKKDL